MAEPIKTETAYETDPIPSNTDFNFDKLTSGIGGEDHDPDPDPDTDPNPDMDPNADPKPDHDPDPEPGVNDLEIPEDFDEIVSDPEPDPDAEEDDNDGIEVSNEEIEKSDLPDKTKQAFIKMRQQIREQKKALKQQTGDAPVADEATQQRLKELEEKLERTNFVESSAFDKQYRRPIVELNEALSATAKDYGIEGPTLVKALGLPRAERAELLAEEISNAAGLSELLPMIAQRDMLVGRANQAIQNAKEERAAYMQAQTQVSAEEVSGALTEAQSELFEAGYTLLQDSKKNPDWLPSIRRSAEALLSADTSKKDLAKAALASTVGKHQVTFLKSRLEKTEQLLAEREKQLSKYVKLKPRNTGGQSQKGKRKAVTSIDQIVSDLVPV